MQASEDISCLFGALQNYDGWMDVTAAGLDAALVRQGALQEAAHLKCSRSRPVKL